MKTDGFGMTLRERGRAKWPGCLTVALAVWQFPPALPAQDAVLEEVIVTAQKREQSLQEVPISVFVMDGEAISDQNLVSLYDLAYNTPAVAVVQGGPSDVLSIRGVSSGNNGGFEQSVGTFVDGVYHGRSRYSRSGFMDIERLEILRGPQSTFFGNSALAGALSWHHAISLDEFAAVGTITVPTLFVWSEGPALTAATVQATARYVQGDYTEKFLAGAGHFFLETAPRELIPLLRDHLNATD